jgi:hypothetical protein
MVERTRISVTPKEIGLVTLFMLLAFATGRFSAPVKTRVERVEVVREIERKKVNQKESQSQDHSQQVITTERQSPDGTVTRRTRTIQLHRESQGGEKTETSLTAQERAVQEVKESERSSRTLSLGILVGGALPLSHPTSRLGAYALVPFLGPLDLGLWATNEISLGFSVGLSF